MSEQTVLSNLYHGIQNVELCIKSKCSQHLVTCEKMLQAPASLDENGVTAGVSNAFLVCCAYFYLCLLRKVEGDEVQVALYFLQALVVSPGLVKTELAPEVYRKVVESCIVPLRPELGSGVEGVRWGATSYKAWLMYYQVISYGQQPTLLMDTSPEFRNTKVCSTSSSKSYEHVQLHAQNVELCKGASC
uniref:Putative E3 ubiquitin-protein ligase LIN-1 isoform X1 n=1 Tax=Tanacetum cinerariifolium TaxID=118510 RepID=A0A699KR50_TANCI|nr:putative E3 ubiquitin-protein ligase LIN-1 isoform X1 [Tanacetum cinerariifolium]